MGWLPSFLGGEKSNDPLRNLDPKLREFLEKESPVKYTTSEPPSSQPAKAGKDGSAAVADVQAGASGVPSASLYQDGRYAGLWKTYRPLNEVEAETATDHDKLASVLEGYKERKSAIARAALENCALHQEEWVNCMKHGNWEDQLQMCRHQVRRFEKCYDMQARFLRTLGYGSVLDRPAEIDEDIQMHSDALWQRMLQHDREAQKAKAEGLPTPKFDPVVPIVTRTAFAPPEEVERAWKEKLSKLPEDERPAEEAALRSEFNEKMAMARDVKSLRQAERDARKARQASGSGTFMDTITSLFGGSK